MNAKRDEASAGASDSALALALYVVGFATLAWPWLSGAVTIPWDAKAHWYPHLAFLARAIHSGESPFWTPNIFLGSPEIADPQSAIFSLPLLITALIDPAPGPQALDRAVFVMLFAGGLGVIALFREKGWHPAGGAVAALAFAFGAAAAWRIQHINQVISLAFLPIVWVLLLLALRRRSVWFGLAAGLVGAMMVVGRDQVALIGVYLLVAQVVTHWVSAPRPVRALLDSLPPLVAGAILGLVLVAVPVVMSVLWGWQSNRVAIDIEGAGRGSLHPAHLLTLAVGNLFGAAGPLAEHWGPPSPTWGDSGLFLARNMGVLYAGLLPLALILALVRTGDAARREIAFVAIALGMVGLYGLGWYTGLWPAFWLLPGADLYRRPADAAFVIGLLAAILAGYGLHRLMTGTLATGWRIEAGLIALLIVGGAGLIVWKGAPVAAWTAVAVATASAIAALVLLVLAPRLPRQAFMVLVVLVLVIDLRITNGPSESTALPPSTYDVLTPGSADPTLAAIRRLTSSEPGARERVELIGLPYHWQNASLAQNFDDTLGFNPVRSTAVTDLFGAGDIALVGVRRFPPAFPGYDSVAAEMFGPRYIVSGVPIETIDRRLGTGRLVEVARTAEAIIHENPRVLPRVWVATEAIPTPADLGTAGFPAGLDPRRTVLVDGAARQFGGSGEARLVSYRNGLVTVYTETQSGGMLVLADAHHPWWVARIEGREVPLLKAYGLVRAVEVPAGRSRVTFTFEPFAGAFRELSARLTARRP